MSKMRCGVWGHFRTMSKTKALFLKAFFYHAAHNWHHAAHFWHNHAQFWHHATHFWQHVAHSWYHVKHFCHHAEHFWHHAAHFQHHASHFWHHAAHFYYNSTHLWHNAPQFPVFFWFSSCFFWFFLFISVYSNMDIFLTIYCYLFTFFFFFSYFGDSVVPRFAWLQYPSISLYFLPNILVLFSSFFKMIQKLDTRISFVRSSFVRSYVTLSGPPLDSETGWTGELWSNHVLLILEN